MIRVLVWDENPSHADPQVYPESIRGAVASGLRKFGGANISVSTAHLDEPEQGITAKGLAATDVLVWWGHIRHGELKTATVNRIVRRVHQAGMGFVAIHSSHYSKPLQKILKCEGHLKGGWRVAEPPEREEIRVCAPWHPIARGIEDFVLDQEEMYGAPFAVPPPLALVLQSHFPLDGKTFPSGICWTVGNGIQKTFRSGGGGGQDQGEGIGRVFYFRPGHESFSTLQHPVVLQILANAVLWCGKAT